MTTLTFDCPQGCDKKLEVETPRIDGGDMLTRKSLWDQEYELGRRVMSAVIQHAIYECRAIVPTPVTLETGEIP